MVRSGADRWTMLATGMVLGGAIGNMIDRLRFDAVTDFLHLSHWPTFNVADMGITVGVTIIILTQIFRPESNAR
jgi:signal peptidase II